MTTDLSADEEWRTNFERGKLEAQAAMVRNMLKLGCSSELIQQVSGFDDRQMAQLQQELACEAAGLAHGQAEAQACVARNMIKLCYPVAVGQKVKELLDIKIPPLKPQNGRFDLSYALVAGFLHGRAEALKCVERNIRTKGYSLELIQQVTSLDDAGLTKIRHEVAAKRKW